MTPALIPGGEKSIYSVVEASSSQEVEPEEAFVDALLGTGITRK